MVRKLFMKYRSKQILKSLQTDSGLFIAAPADETGYGKAAWIRDNIYEALGMYAAGDTSSVKKTFHALFDVLKKHEYKIDHAIRQKPDAAFKYIHARFHPQTFDEFHEHWGNKQNDAIGAMLFSVGMMFKEGIKVFRDVKDIEIIQKLVHYLESIEYWHDPDHGVWENREELHASSVGACVGGLKAVKGIVDVPQWLIDKGIATLDVMLPCESETKPVDLALLTLIWPYKVVTVQQRALILKNVENLIVKENGVVRYFGDWYYNEGEEAQWTMGFAWLAKIYKELGRQDKYDHYMDKLHGVSTTSGKIPELYYLKNGAWIPNENTPLGWNHAMYLMAVA